jgi:AraC-like DNA-binding protein
MAADHHTMTTPRGASTVSVGLIQLLKHYAAGLGIDFDAAAQGGGAQAVLPDDPNARVSGRLFESMWRQVVTSGLDPYPGLSFGREMARHYPGGSIVFTMMMNCATIGRALDTFVRYHRIVADAIQPQISLHGDWVHLSWEVRHTGIAAHPHISEALLCIYRSILERLSQNRVGPIAVSFTHAGPDDTHVFEDVFNSPVRFNARCNELVIEAAALAMEIPFANQVIFKAIERQAVNMTDLMDRTAGWTDRVTRLICNSLEKGILPDIDTVAKQLAVSRRSLQQKLNQEGTTYRNCLASVRKQTALDLLVKPDFTICDVAFVLGYSEQSAFNHAFRRWTGMTPGAHCLQST